MNKREQWSRPENWNATEFTQRIIAASLEGRGMRQAELPRKIEPNRVIIAAADACRIKVVNPKDQKFIPIICGNDRR